MENAPTKPAIVVATKVPAEMFDSLSRLAAESERTIAAEARVAFRAHIDAAADSLPKAA